MPAQHANRRLLAAAIVAAAIGIAIYLWPPPPLPRFDNVDFGLDGTAASVFAPDKLLAFELTVAPHDLAHMQANARDEVPVPAQLSIGKLDVGTVGLRYKGSTGTLHSVLDERRTDSYFPKLSLKILFDFAEPGRRFCELRRLNFHSMIYDGSLMRERLCYQAFRDAGITAPRCSHAMVFVNGSFAGIFSMVEQIDAAFVCDRFGDDDHSILYKEVWPTNPNAGRYREKERHNPAGRPHDVMTKLARDVRAAADTELPAIVGKHADLDQLTRHFVLDHALKNWDGVRGWTSATATDKPWNHNYYWFVSAQDRLTLMPWDLDATLRHPGRRDELPRWHDLTPPEDRGHATPNGRFAWAPNRDPITRAVAVHARDRHRQVLAELLDGPLRLDRQLHAIDAWSAQIRAAVAHDPHLGSLWQWEWQLGKLRSNLRDIHRWLRSGSR